LFHSTAQISFSYQVFKDTISLTTWRVNAPDQNNQRIIATIKVLWYAKLSGDIWLELSRTWGEAATRPREHSWAFTPTVSE